MPEIAATPENSYSQMMQRLAVDSPQLREIASRTHLSQHARRNLDRFLSSAGTTSERYGAVLRSPAAVERALTIFEYSEFLTDILVRHPEAVALLNEIAGSPTGVRTTSCSRRSHRSKEPTTILFSPISGRERWTVRKPCRSCASSIAGEYCLSGALDLFHRRDVFDSLKDNTAAADAAIRAALAMAGAPGLASPSWHSADSARASSICCLMPTCCSCAIADATATRSSRRCRAVDGGSDRVHPRRHRVSRSMPACGRMDGKGN